MVDSSHHLPLLLLLFGPGWTWTGGPEVDADCGGLADHRDRGHDVLPVLSGGVCREVPEAVGLRGFLQEWDVSPLLPRDSQAQRSSGV